MPTHGPRFGMTALAAAWTGMPHIVYIVAAYVAGATR